MTKPSSSAARLTPVLARNRWISPRQAEMLESLWNVRLRLAGRRPRPERCREERLRHIAETVGRSVTSPRELTWREANRVLRRLLEEVRSANSLPMSPNDSAPAPRSGVSSASPARAAKRARKPPPASTSRKNSRCSTRKVTERRKKRS